MLKDARTDLAVLRIKGSGERFPALEFGNSDELAGRRPGARHRQSVRRRPDRDARHRLGAGAHPGRHHRLPVLHPDRRRHQSRQFRRRAGRHDRQAGRHQHRDLLALRRLASASASRSRPTWCRWWWPRRASGGNAVKRPWLGARLQTVTPEIAESLGLKRPAGALVAQRDAEEPGGARRAEDRRPDRGDRRPGDRGSQRLRLPLRHQAARRHQRASASIRTGRETTVTVALESAPELPREELDHRVPLAVPGRQGRQPLAGARRRAAARSVERRAWSIVDVANGSLGAAARLPARRRRADGQRPEGRPRPRDLDKLTRQQSRLWRITILRGGQQMSVELRG